MSEMKKIEISILKRVSHSYIFMNSVNVWSMWDFRCLELAKKYFDSFLYFLWHFTKIPFPADICTPREVSMKGYQLLNKLLMETVRRKRECGFPVNEEYKVCLGWEPNHPWCQLSPSQKWRSISSNLLWKRDWNTISRKCSYSKSLSWKYNIQGKNFLFQNFF